MNNSKSSITKTASLRPELEFEVIKLTLLRENYIKRLSKSLLELRTELDIGIIGLVDVLRDASIQVVDTIHTWERAQVNYPNITPYMWNGEEYLHKMLSDTDFLADNKQLSLWLGFSLFSNPFFVPQDIFVPNFHISKQSYVVFGIPPHKRASNINDPHGLSAFSSIKKDIPKLVKSIKSPYNTPIINDTKLLPSASVTRAKALIKQRKLDKSINENDELDKDEIGVNVYETYLSHDTISKIQKCWILLCDRYGFSIPFLNQFMSSNNNNYIDNNNNNKEHSIITSIIQESENNDNSNALLLPNKPDMLSSTINDLSNNFNNNNNNNNNKEILDNSLITDQSHFLETSKSMLHIEKQKTKIAFQIGLDASAGITTDISNNKFMRIKYFDSSNNELNNFSTFQPNNSVLHDSGSIIGGQTYGIGQSISNTTMRFGITDITTQPFIWTAHDIKLQKSVYRKGGELFTLTAAGTQGRMKAPYRKSRLERMKLDYDNIIQQKNKIEMAMEDPKINELLEEASKFVEIVAPTPQLSKAEEIQLQMLKRNKKNLKETLNDIQLLDESIRIAPSSYLHHIKLDMNYLKQIKKLYSDMEYFLKYQMETFKKIMHSDINHDLKYLKNIRESVPGSALLADEMLSINLENKMAYKIQSIVRKKFGRKVRAAIIKKRLDAVIIIQGTFRKYSKKKASVLRIAQYKLAIYVQKLYRSKKCSQQLKSLIIEIKRNTASLILQRVYRGYYGRKRIKLKKEFVQCVLDAKEAVSAKYINNNSLEDLCEIIDFFIKDYRIDLPIGVITVLRGILFMFLGNNYEKISTHQSGYFKPIYLKAINCSYQNCLQILRRKGKFIRRLRCLASSIFPPNARKLPFNNYCQTHLDDLVKYIKESDFNIMEKGKLAIINLYKYCCSLKRAFDLQQYFPEFFCKSLPNWFKKLMKLKINYEKSRLSLLTAESCKQHINYHKEIFTKKGLRWKAISSATNKTNIDINNSEIEYNNTKKLLDYCLKKLNEEDNKKIIILEDLLRARNLGVEVAKRDLEDYLRISIVPLPAQIKSLEINLEERKFIALEAESTLFTTKKVIEEGIAARSFDKLFHLKKINDTCILLGQVIADLYVLEQSWADFLYSIGGEQFLIDLIGADKEEYLNYKTKSLKLMSKRRTLINKLDKGLNLEVEKVSNHIFNSIQIPNWDTPTPQMELAAIIEDKECAKKEADVEEKQRVSLDTYYIPLVDVQPIILLLDRRIPNYSKKCIINRLETLDFINTKKDQCDPKLAEEIQNIIDNKKNVIICVDRGLHRKARFHFITYFESIIGLLIPKPRIIALDATASFFFENWHSMFSTDYIEVNLFNIYESDECCMTLGKTRRISCLFELCLFSNSNNNMIDVEYNDIGSDSSTLTGTAVSHNNINNKQENKENKNIENKNIENKNIEENKENKENKNIKEKEINNNEIKKNNFWNIGTSLFNAISGNNDNKEKEEIKINNKEINTTVIPLEPSIHHRSVLLSVWSHCSLSITGFGSVTPYWFRNSCYDDFHDFINELSMNYELKTSASSFNSASIGELSQLSSISHSGMVLAATIAALLDLWDAPLLSWKEGEINSGCKAFLLLANNYHLLCDKLSLRTLPICNILKLRKIEHARELVSVWKTQYENMSIIDHPARYLLSFWCLETIRLLELICMNGGPADENDIITLQRSSIEIMHTFEWTKDAYVYGSENIIGNLLEKCFQKDLVYENKNCSTIAFLHKTDIENLKGQLLETLQCYRHIKIYHRNNNAYVAFKLNKGEFLRIQDARSVVDSVAYNRFDNNNNNNNNNIDLDEMSFNSPSHISANEESSWFYFQKVSIGKVVACLHPTAMEMFEGKPPRYNLNNENDAWYRLLSEWIKIDNLGDEFELNIIRKRSLTLSRLGKVDGYHCRLEIFEEKHGEIIILVHGILKNRLLKFVYTKKLLSDLLFICDEKEEKEKIEAIDIHSLANICSDRLRILPTARWSGFLQFNEFSPACQDHFLEKSRARLSMRLKKGPGRHTGTKGVRIGGLFILISIYEISNETEAHSLRIIIYEPKLSQTIEYRLSPMERLMLFKDNINMFKQIIDRLIISYCNTANNSRKLLTLDSNYKHNTKLYDKLHPKTSIELEVESDDTFKILTKTTNQLFKKLKSSEDESDNDDNVLEMKNNQNLSILEDFNHLPIKSIEKSSSNNIKNYLMNTKQNDTNNNDNNSNNDNNDNNSNSDNSIISIRYKNDDYDEEENIEINNEDEIVNNLNEQSSSYISSYETSIEEKKISLHSSIEKSVSTLPDDQNIRLHKIKENFISNDNNNNNNDNNDNYTEQTFSIWGWALYFNRTTLSKMIGSNIVVTMNLYLENEGFALYARDNKTCFELYTYITLEQACSIYYDKTLTALQIEIATFVDESIIYDLIDDLLNTVDIIEIEGHEDYYELCFVSEQNDEIRISIGVLKKSNIEINNDDINTSDIESLYNVQSDNESDSESKLNNITEIINKKNNNKDINENKELNIRETLLNNNNNNNRSNTDHRKGISVNKNHDSNSINSKNSQLSLLEESNLNSNNNSTETSTINELDINAPSLILKENEKSYFFINTPLNLEQNMNTIRWKYKFINWNHPIVTKLEKKTFNNNNIINNNIKENIICIKYKIEYAANYTIDKTSDLKEESRICWRGRVKPNNVSCLEAGAEETKQKLFQPLTSKVILNKALHEMKVLAEYIYLTDNAKTLNRHDDDLPICIKEVVSEGAGRISRMFRVEVLTNSGLKFGHADIHDEIDLMDVLGADKCHLLKQGQRDLAQAFEYIARERLMLNMMPMKRKVLAGGRREGVRVDSSQLSGAAGSLASLLRDSEIKKNELNNNVNNNNNNNSKIGLITNTKGKLIDITLSNNNNNNNDDDESLVGLKIDHNADNNSIEQEKLHWVRIYVKTHRSAGRSFRTLVMLLSSDLEFWLDTNTYIKNKTEELGLHGCLTSFTLQFKSFDNLGKNTKILTLNGPQLFNWLPEGFNLDCLKNQYRRRKFGEYLLQNLRIEYISELADFKLKLVERKKNKELYKTVQFGSIPKPPTTVNNLINNVNNQINTIMDNNNIINNNEYISDNINNIK